MINDKEDELNMLLEDLVLKRIQTNRELIMKYSKEYNNSNRSMHIHIVVQWYSTSVSYRTMYEILQYIVFQCPDIVFNVWTLKCNVFNTL